MATVTFSAADDVLYAYLAGEIDHDAAQNLRIQLDDALLNRTPRTLVLDFGGVGFMDSSGVGLILGCCGAISEWAGRYEMTEKVNEQPVSYTHLTLPTT